MQLIVHGVTDAHAREERYGCGPEMKLPKTLDSVRGKRLTLRAVGLEICDALDRMA